MEKNFVNNYYFCADVGGTVIKGGIVDEKYKLLCSDSISSVSVKQDGNLAELLIALFKNMEEKSGFKLNESSGVGIGLPGLVNSKTGVIKMLPNMGITEYDIVKKLKKSIAVPIKIGNDAALATLAEWHLGAGKNHDNFILITLGTGVGCGIVVEGKPLRDTLPYACEFGHNFMDNSCKDCLDFLVSTRALINRTKLAMQENKQSKIWTKYNLENVDGKAVFEFADTDETIKNVLSDYIKDLGMNLVNLCNIFPPELIIIGGGISKQGKKLTKPLEEYINQNIFLKNVNAKVKVVPATFLNDAGILGARCMFE